MVKINLKSLIKNRKGISPVIATVIIVAVTITVAVAISYWMGGIAGLYTRFEKIEITYATVTYSENKGWNITIGIKNTGSADATIDNVLLNGVPVGNVDGVFVNGTHKPAKMSYIVKSGYSAILYININENINIGTSKASSGLSLEIKLHTAAGKDYPKLITLP